MTSDDIQFNLSTQKDYFRVDQPTTSSTPTIQPFLQTESSSSPSPPLSFISPFSKDKPLKQANNNLVQNQFQCQCHISSNEISRERDQDMDLYVKCYNTTSMEEMQFEPEKDSDVTQILPNPSTCESLISVAIQSNYFEDLEDGYQFLESVRAKETMCAQSIDCNKNTNLDDRNLEITRLAERNSSNGNSEIFPDTERNNNIEDTYSNHDNYKDDSQYQQQSKDVSLSHQDNSSNSDPHMQPSHINSHSQLEYSAQISTMKTFTKDHITPQSPRSLLVQQNFEEFSTDRQHFHIEKHTHKSEYCHKNQLASEESLRDKKSTFPNEPTVSPSPSSPRTLAFVQTAHQKLKSDFNENERPTTTFCNNMVAESETNNDITEYNNIETTIITSRNNRCDAIDNGFTNECRITSCNVNANSDFNTPTSDIGIPFYSTSTTTEINSDIGKTHTLNNLNSERSTVNGIAKNDAHFHKSHSYSALDDIQKSQPFSKNFFKDCLPQLFSDASKVHRASPLSISPSSTLMRPDYNSTYHDKTIDYPSINLDKNKAPMRMVSPNPVTPPYDTTVKVILLGDYNVGKTSMLRSLSR